MLNSDSDLEVIGFPAQFNMSYECYSSRKTNYFDGQIQNDFMNLYDGVQHIQNGNMLIQYTNQTSPGQSGGAVLLHLENSNRKHLIGIHVSRDKVSIICLFLFNLICSLRF